MTTRYYFVASSSGNVPFPAAVAVTPSATWDETNDADPACALKTARTGFGVGAPSSSALSFAQNAKQLACQHVGPQIGAGTITGTVKGQALAYSGFLKNVTTLIGIRVVSGDGATVRGTLLAVANNSTGSNLNGLAGRNIKLSNGASLSSVTAQNGDRIVIELGFTSASATPSGSIQAYAGQNAPSSDLPEDETETDDTLASWVEFSQTIAAFDPNPAAMMQVF